jgi:hypothetical protein
LKLLDSGLRRNDGKLEVTTFYETIDNWQMFGIKNKSPVRDGQASTRRMTEQLK